MSGAARAQTPVPSPEPPGLALPPSSAQDQPPVIIAAPVPPGLALPPPAAAAPPPKPVVISAPEPAPAPVPAAASGDAVLGAGMWKGTTRALAENFLPLLTPPLPFAALNGLALRFLLVTAAAPEGLSDSRQSITALRADKLVALGKPAEAWKLANDAGLDQFDTIGLRQIAENALVSSAQADVCAKLPAILQKHADGDWQKLMVVCQLQANDAKGAQVSLDLLHSQGIHDDSFFALAEKNVIANGKQLPRQLTPLTPLDLALIRLTDLPLRSEVYVHPAAALIPELLKAKPEDEGARLALAERAAAKGLITSQDLIAVYAKPVFSADSLSGASLSGEQGPMLRAMLYQTSQQEKNPQNRVAAAVKFLQSLDAAAMNGSVLPVMGVMLGEVQPAASFNAVSATVARMYMLAGKTAEAPAWLELAHNAAGGPAPAGAELQSLWPLVVFAGLESVQDFPKDLNAWLASLLRPADRQDANRRAQKAAASSLLLLFDAMGFPVGDDAWAQAADSAAYEKTMMTPALILEKLRAAAAANRKGETILMSLLACGGGKDDPPVIATVDTIRGLRQIGLTAEAGNLAKEAAVKILAGVKF